MERGQNYNFVEKGKSLTSSHFVVGVQTARRGFVSTTDALLEKITIKVPTMGDSITEVNQLVRLFT